MIGDEVMCAGKMTYKSYAAAINISKSLNRRSDKARGNVYRCLFCQKYHVGNSFNGDKKRSNTPYKRLKRIDRYSEHLLEWYDE